MLLRRKNSVIGLRFFVIAAIIFVAAFSSAQAQSVQKSYSYDLIAAKFRINQDSTVDVEEIQTFNFTGSFHAGLRTIPLKKIDSITDIFVVDETTDIPLQYSPKALDKLDPASWGKFTTFKKNGIQNIEWYYNLENTRHAWIIGYKVHGSIEFGNPSDRFYWNVFTDYDVPVANSTAEIFLPGDFSGSEVFIGAYRNKNDLPVQNSGLVNKNSVSLASLNFNPKEPFTIDIKWPKGFVSKSAYWFDFFKTFYGFIIAPLVIFLSFLFGFIYWLKNEKLKKGRGTIVPQYEPPENLRPAMAEIITKEKLSEKALAATIIDLAVRGFVKIEEAPPLNLWKIISAFFKKTEVSSSTPSGNINSVRMKFENFSRWVKFLPYILLLAFFVMLFSFGNNHSFSSALFFGVIFLFALLPVLLRFIFKSGGRGKKDYLIKKTKEFVNDSNLHDYEKEYLSVLFASKDVFSTREMKISADYKKKAFYLTIQKMKENIIKETELDTSAFEVSLSKEYKSLGIFIGSIVLVCFFFLFITGNLNTQVGQFVIIIVAVILSVLGLFLFIKYEARLSQMGRILKEDWLGFKMYLETAEKYRLQNLTPDLFEKFLPYAMIFGIEKKWSRAFEGMHLPPPNWYGGAMVTGGAVGAASGVSFSPTGFSTSFSSAFSSAFSSSGAGGGGGGGSGGGGGGGGGGGAS
ncbi:MAG: DUF2207 domain-containing protein [Patescibacteria group bacterium]|nr:DUF2207 domain-containing protein [Patescibacteria group bacterium]